MVQCQKVLSQVNIYMVQCQKVLSQVNIYMVQSLKNEMSLTVVIGACFGGSFFIGNGFVRIKDES